MRETSSLEEAQLDHPGGVEAFDPECGTRGGRYSTGGQQADELRAGDLDTERCRLGLDPRDDLVRRRSFPILDVHGHLHDPRSRQREAERTHAGEAAAALAHEPGNRPRRLDIDRAEIDVERDQRAPGADDHAAGRRIEPGRAEVGLKLAGRDPALQLLRSAAPEECRAAASSELAVEEDGQLELGADPLRDTQSDRLRLLHLRRNQRHDGHDVGGADPRVNALVAAEVDVVARAGDPGDKSLDECIVSTDEREDGAVVVGVDVHVEQARVSRERRSHRLDDLGIAPLRDVRHRLQRQLHGAYPTAVEEYYEQRAPEYDDWWLGTGLFEQRDRPGWEDERAALIDAIAALEPMRTLDVACGTGFLTQHLPGELTALDQSPTMIEIAAARSSCAVFVRGDALPLPFSDDAFERIFTAHFYGHLEDDARTLFLSEARRVARELVVVDSALRDDVQAEERQERVLNDGSRHEVYKRYFTAEELVEELGGGETLFAGRWFVAVRSPR